jgi:hypothetical protein
MAEKSESLGEGYLTTEERQFLSDRGIERASNLLMTQAAAKLIVQLGLAPAASTQFVDAVRSYPLNEETDFLEATLEVTAAIDNLRFTLAKRGAATLRAVQQTDMIDTTRAVIEAPRYAIDDVPIESSMSVEAVENTVEAVAAATHGAVVEEELSEDANGQAIKLNKRSHRYMQAVFGEIDDMNLKEGDKCIIAKTLMELRGEPNGVRQYADRTQAVIMMLEGLKDSEIAMHTGLTAQSVAGGFSALIKRIKDQPEFSYHTARTLLQAKRQSHIEISDDETASGNAEMVEDAESNERDDTESQTVSIELKQTARTGILVGAIRRHLRKAGRDHMIELNEKQLEQLIHQVFEMHAATSAVRNDYLRYLSEGVKQPGDSVLNECINNMHQYIAEIVAESSSNVLPITTPTHHKRAAMTPADMPKIHAVLPFVPPRHKSDRAASQPFAHIEVVNGAELVEVPVLVAAAYREEAMSQEVWYKLAHQSIQTASKQLGLNAEESLTLWDAVHFHNKHKENMQRSPATIAVLGVVEKHLIEQPGRLAQFPEIERSLKKFLNNFSSENQLHAIQASLKRDDQTIYDRAAQRYVVAGISEIAKE